MGYYVRVFCKSERKPTVREILEYLNSLDYNYNAITQLPSDELDSRQWSHLELQYNYNKLPILIDCNRITDTDGLAKAEIEGFINQIGKPGFFDWTKKKIIKHLKETKYIITNQLPTSDIDDDGYDINGESLNYFADNCDGLIQADGEGFYEGTKLIFRIN